MSQISKLQNMVFDEVSLVRRPANQHASIVFSKADEGAEMTVLVTEDGQEVDIDDLEVGTEIEFDNGEVYTVVDADDADEDDEDADAREYEPQDEADYGKSADYGQLIAKAYEEAVTDEDKANLFATVAKSAQIAKAQASAAAQTMENMRTDSFIDTCISKADEYGFAGQRTEQFGVVIAKMMTVLEPEEIQLVDDIFKAFSSLIDETAIGSEYSEPSEIMDIVDGVASDIVKSTDGALTSEQAFTAAFDANPDLYNLYLAEKEGR